MDLARGFVKGNVRFVVMRRHLSLAVASAILALAVAGFLGAASTAVPWHESGRAVTSPLTELQAVPAGVARAEASTTASHDPVLLASSAFALAAAAGYVVRERRRRVYAARRAWSAPLRGPPRLALI